MLPEHTGFTKALEESEIAGAREGGLIITGTNNLRRPLLSVLCGQPKDECSSVSSSVIF